GTELFEAERVAGFDHRDHTETIESDVIERSFLNFPRQDGVLAAQTRFRIGETGTRPDVTSARLQVMARKAGRLDGSGGKQYDGDESKPTFHARETPMRGRGVIVWRAREAKDCMLKSR